MEKRSDGLIEMEEQKRATKSTTAMVRRSARSTTSSSTRMTNRNT